MTHPLTKKQLEELAIIGVGVLRDIDSLANSIEDMGYKYLKREHRDKSREAALIAAAVTLERLRRGEYRQEMAKAAKGD